VLRDCARDKREYRKRNVVFWTEGGKLEVAKKVQRISHHLPNHVNQKHNLFLSISKRRSKFLNFLSFSRNTLALRWLRSQERAISLRS
jgi:hypothetical protein